LVDTASRTLRAVRAGGQVVGDLDKLARRQRVTIGAAEDDFFGSGAELVGEVLLEVIEGKLNIENLFTVRLAEVHGIRARAHRAAGIAFVGQFDVEDVGAGTGEHSVRSNMA
jgi:hypothetical protein